MKNLVFKTLLFFCVLAFANNSSAQSTNQKKTINDSEKAMIQLTFNEISISDQLYRNPLAKGTLDKKIITQIDSVFDNEGIEAGLTYEKSLNLSLPKHIEDSLWNLQHAIDLRNHLTLRGLWETYGFISKEIVEKNQHVQILALMHPPKDWDIRTYHQEYSNLLLTEVKAGRMPAKTYAMFYDNIKGKILKEPQLYGTNQRFSMETNSILPPLIEDIDKTNEARKAIGLPTLNEGEYELSE